MPNEIIEQPASSETYIKLKEPEKPITPDYDEAMMWRSRIEAARKLRDKKLEKLPVLLQMYAGNQWGDIQTSLGDLSTINLIYASIKEEMPALYFQNPVPVVEAIGQGSELGAFAMKELLRTYTKSNIGVELKKHVRLCMLDAKFSYGVSKTTYTPMFTSNPRAGKPVIAGIDDIGKPIFVFDDDNNLVLEEGEILTSELYFTERLSPREVLIDVRCRNFPEKAEWIGHEIVKPLSYLKDNPLYNNTASVQPNMEVKKSLENLGKETDGSILLSAEQDTQLVRFVEIYDLKNQKLLVLPDNHDFFIRKIDFGMNPFSFLKYNEFPDEFYAPSDVDQQKPLQEEVNIGRSLMVTHARRSARKYYYTEDTFRNIDKVEGYDAMQSSNDMTLVKIAEYDKPPAPIQSAQQDASIFLNMQQSRVDFNTIAGSTEAQRGMSERRKTKGEATFQEQHGAIRRGDKQSLVADFIADIYRKTGKLMQETLTIPQAVKVIGKAGVFWTQIKRTDLKGEFNYSVDVAEMRPSIPEIERQEISEFIFGVAQFLNAVLANPVGPMIFNIGGCIGEFAKAYPSIKTEKMLNGQFTPMQIAGVMLAQMQQGTQTNINNRTINEGDIYEGE